LFSSNYVSCFLQNDSILIGGGSDGEYFEESEDGSLVNISDKGDENHVERRKAIFIWFNNKATILHFEVGMCFESTKQFKAALINHSLKVHREIKLVKNDRSRV
jgi:MuDR family transposase